ALAKRRALRRAGGCLLWKRDSGITARAAVKVDLEVSGRNGEGLVAALPVKAVVPAESFPLCRARGVRRAKILFNRPAQTRCGRLRERRSGGGHPTAGMGGILRPEGRHLLHADRVLVKEIVSLQRGAESSYLLEVRAEFGLELLLGLRRQGQE